jgi:hypothetical protein
MGVAVSLRVVDCEGYQRSRRARMDIVDGVVAGRLLPLGLGNAGDRSRQGRVEAFAMRGLRRNGAARPIDDGVLPWSARGARLRPASPNRRYRLTQRCAVRSGNPASAATRLSGTSCSRWGRSFRYRSKARRRRASESSAKAALASGSVGSIRQIILKRMRCACRHAERQRPS